MRLVILFLAVTSSVLADELDPHTDDLSVPGLEVKYSAPTVPAGAFLAETFDGGLGSRWVKSQAKKDGADEDIAKYNGEWEVRQADSSPVVEDVGLVLTTKARHAAISAKLNRPFSFSGKPLVVQYEVKYQNGMDCGGSYMKLLTDEPGLDLKQVTDKSGYTIMFGPDTCGMDKKLHFIMRHKQPKTGVFEEKHAKKASGNLDFYGDKKTHLFRLTVQPDNSWEVHVDDAMINSGNLLEDMTPPINPLSEVEDPEDFKPASWDDRQKIPDPAATKPIDWDEDAPEFVLDEAAVKPAGWLDDEQELIPDPSAEMPTDWDEEMDGEWEAAKIENAKCQEAPGCGEWTRPNKRNPDYRGKWKPEMIDNPDYSGVWAARKIPNPDYFEDKEPYRMSPIGAVAFELWSMTDSVLFDNVLITDDISVADTWTAQTWHIKRDAELAESVRNAAPMLQPVYDMLEERPWLWGVLTVALLIPIAGIFYCCTGSSSKTDSTAAGRKKTDAFTPDDDAAKAEEEAEEEDSGADGDKSANKRERSSSPTKRSSSPTKRSSSPTKRSSSPTKRSSSPSKTGRDALSEPADPEEEEEEEVAAEDEAPAGVSQDEELSPDEGAQQEEATTGTTRKSPRKRKPRKE